MMTRILDKDLWFLDERSNEELEILFNILCFEKDGSPRKRGHLLHSLESQIFDRDYYKFSDKIGEELQLISNSKIGDFLRNKKNSYHEVIALVMNALGFEFDNSLSAPELEKVLLQLLIDKTVGLSKSGVSTLPFEILVDEAYTEEVKADPVLRCIIPATIYISLLRTSLEKDNFQEGKETILK